VNEGTIAYAIKLQKTLEYVFVLDYEVVEVDFPES